MVRIALLFPSAGFFEGADQLFQQHCQFQRDFEAVTEEYTLEELVMPLNQFNHQRIAQYDVIISRGITAELFRQHYLQPPLVEIPVAGNDLVCAMLQIYRKVGDKAYAVIGAHNMLFGAEQLAETLGMRVCCYERHTNDDWNATVDQAIADGCEALLGGVETCAYARGKGLPCQVIKTGREALWQAFSEAKKLVEVQRTEQRKTMRYKLTLDYAYEGIMEIGPEGTLRTLNRAAWSLLGLQEVAQERNIRDCLPPGSFRDLLLNNTDCENRLVSCGALQLAVNKAALRSEHTVWGYIVTFQDVTKLQQMERSIRKQLHDHGYVAKHVFSDILGKSPELTAAIEQAKKYAAVDVDILITGASGTGKELFAQSIHNASMRAGLPFVAVNCAALNENLLESELFGYVEGAFTGALKGGKKGLFEQAHGGTIFLDEIAEISTALQCKLLRVLQEREVMRLGDDRIIPLDIRVIAATNKDLMSYVQEGKFREDLYYRLDLLRVKLPPLNARRGDIPFLAQHFIDLYAAQYRRGRGGLMLGRECGRYLAERTWAGNIRELRNICLRLVVSSQGDQVEMGELRAVLDEGPVSEKCRPQTAKLPDEREAIRKALEQSGYHRARAAELLHMSRSTLWKRMKQYGLNDGHS